MLDYSAIGFSDSKQGFCLVTSVRYQCSNVFINDLMYLNMQSSDVADQSITVIRLKGKLFGIGICEEQNVSKAVSIFSFYRVEILKLNFQHSSLEILRFDMLGLDQNNRYKIFKFKIFYYLSYYC